MMMIFFDDIICKTHPGAGELKPKYMWCCKCMPSNKYKDSETK